MNDADRQRAQVDGATPMIGPLQLSPVDEERAARLHRDSLVFIAHDHCIADADIRRMVAGGVTAKQLHVSVDVRIGAPSATYQSSTKGPGLTLEGSLDPTTSDGFLKSALIALDHVDHVVAQSDGLISIALEPGDILAAKRRGGIALLLGAEGARLTEYRLEVLRILARLGLRHLQLSWAVDHPLGTTQSDTSGRGLTPLGLEFVRELNRLGLIVDVSHLSYRSIADAIDASVAPVLNGHSGALALNPTASQLLPDELIREMARKGGVVAVHFMSQIVKPGRHKATMVELMAQFEYLAKLVGVDHIACGPDYLTDGGRVALNQGIDVPFDFTDGLEDVSTMRNLTRAFVASGFSDSDIAKMLGGNLLRIFESARAVGREGIPPPERPSAPTGSITGGITPL